MMASLRLKTEGKRNTGLQSLWKSLERRDTLVRSVHEKYACVVIYMCKCLLRGLIEIEISDFCPKQLRLVPSVQNLPHSMKFLL